ncbi:MAG TPA: UDP-N-acetylmuramoyl-L-alanyl-D-glutamate--2,6-diaminopimelate ligase [Solirubrobacteraceae bacterium]|jgi:UDP-N-acetylmuramoyl-L-alanyl-D-glutamate--2,6-diaminopimelate ligase|nr:UDP-N-acetylmuramoyl-L-alanyl-D-glutamate--2,6-diaminopimelate ligase [Solirubrobacteraceae bacterium]
MRLHDLLAAGMPGVLAPADANPEISAVAYDSRRVGPGALFFCVPGERTDGHRFAQQAVDAGATALVVERPLGLGVPEVQVQSARSAMAAVAARFYGEPTQQLQVVGITGTNGKTTTAFMVRALMQAGGRRCGLLGTVKAVVGGVERPAERTTPEALDLQADFRAMLDAGDLSCAMEVSSHALQLARTEGVRFAAAIFTNLTQDHLDFHHSMEQYFQAKRMLFVGLDAPPLKVLNVGDPYGRRLAQELGDVVTFGVECEADYVARELRIDSRGASARVLTPEREFELNLPLPGRFNVENALGALACVHQLGGDLENLRQALHRGVRVPGRFEPVEEGQGFAVLVDYAHTPDSLSNVLSAAREITQGRVLCVFGAGGDRDRGKRPLMGEIGARLADVAVITSDNPRSEDPQEIVEQVLAGARQARADAVEVQVDRRAAIAHALELALPGDVVVIAGKGHEQGQELAGGVKIPFDDVTVAREELRARRC